MKKLFAALVLFAGIAISPAIVGAAQDAASQPTIRNPAGNPVDQFTGEIWEKTGNSEKRAYLFGIDSAIAVEYFINSKEAARSVKSGKKPVYSLSPFEKGWMEAFKDTTRQQLVDMVDKWYKEHPQNLDRPVLDVIWHEIIAPRLAAAPKK